MNIPSANLRAAVDFLSSPALIRLITEIDDNGPIPPRKLANTLPDLPAHHLRRINHLARVHDLVRAAPGVGLELTTSGVELADVYDAIARWARHHAYPTRVSDFTSRIRYTLRLVAPLPATAPAESSTRQQGVELVDAEPGVDPSGPRALLLQWLNTHPQITVLLDPDHEYGRAA
ncbi:regulator [Streptomyces anulatus]|uniref:Regulator n=1 Tax=Streptomyces anulatus TaxID=1892 RepID=A0A6G3T112_STRAQ|nr:regulator [Streptomyces anulatus]NEB88966.1 regulator [Streptomyces anulatus]